MSGGGRSRMTRGPNADERNLLAELKAAIHDNGENGEPVDRLGAGPMTAATWGCCSAPRRLWRAAATRGFGGGRCSALRDVCGLNTCGYGQVFVPFAGAGWTNPNERQRPPRRRHGIHAPAGDVLGKRPDGQA